MSATPEGPRFFGPMLIARDFDATFRFYREVVRLAGDGASPYAEFGIEGSSKLVVLDGRFWTSVGGRQPDTRGPTARDGVVLAIRVLDVDAEHDRLVREGVPVASPPVDRPQMGLRNLLLLDPDGNVVEFYSDLPPPKG